MTTSQSLFQLELPPLPDLLGRANVDEVYKYGFDAERAEKFNLAAACFEEVRRRQPNNPYVLPDLARVYFQLVEIDRARSLLNQATQLAGDYSDLWYQIGLVYQDARCDHDAERCFLQAITHAGENENIAYTAALIGFYENRGFIAKAEATIESVQRDGARCGLITALQGTVLLRSGNYPAAIAALKSSMLELPEQHSYQINVRYALARALSESQREAASLKYLRQAKVRQESLPEVPLCRRVSEQRFQVMDQVRTELESTDIRAVWRDETASRSRPLVFLLGYPRSGTTLLEQVVESHSAVHSLEETGAIFQATRNLYGQPLAPGESAWDRVNNDDTAGRQQARDWYFEYVARLGAPRDRSTVLLDKNPGLTGHAYMIARLFPDAKILFMVRDPRDICLSAYQTHVTLTPFSVNWLRWSDTVRDCVRTLEHWHALRNQLPNPYLEVRYEDLIGDLPQAGRRIMDFLALEWEPRQEKFAEHARSKQVYSPTLYEVRQGLSTRACGKWRRFGLDYSAGEPGLTSLLERYGYEANHEKIASASAVDDNRLKFQGHFTHSINAAVPPRN